MTSSNDSITTGDDVTPSDIYAALDLGSNSFHLLVARFEASKLVIVDRHKESVRLASGLNTDGTLQNAAMNRALDSLRRFAERLQSVTVNHLRVVGTNTLRAAKNADEFLDQAEAILGAPIDIISGTEEARLIYLGVAQDVAPGDRQRLVIDIGGGSTELVIGGQTAQRLESMYMGCVSLSGQFFADGVITAKAYGKALLAVRADLQSVVSQFKAGRWDEALGSSGTVRAIESVLEGLGLNQDHMITREGLDDLAKKLCDFDKVDNIDLPNLSDERRAVFPGGLAVLHGLFLELGIQRMHVSSYALREGIIFDLAGRNNNKGIRSQTVQRMMGQYHVDTEQAERVARFGRRLFAQVRHEFDAPEWAEQMLVWALSLYETGLAISHSGYHKHGAYILLNSDMPGFSKQEQKLLSFLVLNHRRKLRSLVKTYGFKPDWQLVRLVRLACLFCRRRDDGLLPDVIEIRFNDEGLKLWLDERWLEQCPLTTENLRLEKEYQQAFKLKFDLKTLDRRD